MAENNPDLTYILGRDLTVTYVNPAFSKVTDFPANEIVGRTPAMFVHTDDLPAVTEAVRRSAVEPGRSVAVPAHRVRHRALRWIRFEGLATSMSDDHGLIGFVVTYRSISEHPRAEESIRHRSYVDDLTGLSNRTLFRDRLSRAVSESTQSRRPLAVVLVDLDGFNKVNDALGHAAGDRLLREAARRLQVCVPGVDTVARLGGDEFGIILSELRRPEDAEVTARKVMDWLARPFQFEERELFISASLGIAIRPDDAGDEDTLLSYANSAMYRAKASGGNGYSFFTRQMDEEALERPRLELDLRDALDREELLIHYQPIVELASGAIAGAEALIRWNHPVRGLLAPTAFIHMAEATGLIVPIGAWTFRTACRRLRAWHLKGYGDLTVSINVSPRQCLHPGFGEMVNRAIEEAGVAPGSVTVEITETGLMEKEDRQAIRVIAALREEGVRIALDDFGTGYSSLSYLSRLPVDMLKIDRAFVRNMATDPANRTLVRAIVAMAHGLGIEVVGEGVETEEEAAALRAHDCDGVQGYHFSMPVPADAFARLLGAPLAGRSAP